MTEDELVKKAEQRAKDKLDFFQHLLIYVVVNIFLFALNMIASSDSLWFYWATLGWGIGLFFHWYSVFVADTLFSGYLEREKQKELERLRRQNK